MIEGPLLGGKFWTEPSIVAGRERVSVSASRSRSTFTRLCTLLPALSLSLPLSFPPFYFLPDLGSHRQSPYLAVILYLTS